MEENKNENKKENKNSKKKRFTIIGIIIVVIVIIILILRLTIGCNNKTNSNISSDNNISSNVNDNSSNSSSDSISEHTHELIHHDAVSSTCEIEGNVEYYSCKSCDLLFSDSEAKNIISSDSVKISKKNHTMTLVSKVESTTTSQGHNAYYICSECNHVFKDKDGTQETTIENETLPLHVHNLIKINKIEPTCVEDGTIEHWNCSICNKNYSDANGETEVTSLTINKLGHSFQTTWSKDVNVHYHKCERCDERKDETFHNYVRGVCQDSDCGYSIIDNSDTIVNVPEGVTSLNNYAFSGCSSLTNITLPSTLQTIGNAAFAQTSITSINIPSSVTSIGGYAFMRCTNLKSVILPQGITTIEASMFTNCSSLEYIVIPNSVTSIKGKVLVSSNDDVIIYYQGSASQWNNIDKNNSDNLDLLNKQICYYSEETPTDTTNSYWHYVNGVITKY